MRDDSIVFEIPVPWADRPARISAKGIRAVLVVAAVAVVWILILHWS